jgi:hypothetical protein
MGPTTSEAIAPSLGITPGDESVTMRGNGKAALAQTMEKFARAKPDLFKGSLAKLENSPEGGSPEVFLAAARAASKTGNVNEALIALRNAATSAAEEAETLSPEFAQEFAKAKQEITGAASGKVSPEQLAGQTHLINTEVIAGALRNPKNAGTILSMIPSDGVNVMTATDAGFVRAVETAGKPINEGPANIRGLIKLSPQTSTQAANLKTATDPTKSLKEMEVTHRATMEPLIKASGLSQREQLGVRQAREKFVPERAGYVRSRALVL